MKLLVTCFILAIAMTSHAEVWSHQNTWDEQWEKKYSSWVTSISLADSFTDPGSPYFDFQMNCADFIYVVRAIFAYENHLEFAIKNNGKTLTSRTTQFDSVKSPVARMRNFIQEVINVGSIQSLAGDSFLISIKDISPGDFLLASPSRIHSWLIWKVNQFANPTLLYGTEPESNMIYESYGYPATTEFFENATVAGEGGLGIRRFRWPKELWLNENQMSRASFDQKKYSKKNFFEDIQKDVAQKPVNASDEMKQAVDNACVLSQVRVNAVNWALYQRGLQGGKPFTTDYDSQSTDHRDLELKAAFEQIDKIYSEHSLELDNEARRFYQATIDTQHEFCRIDWAENRREPIGAIRLKSLSGLLSPNPNDSLAKRWGE